MSFKISRTGECRDISYELTISMTLSRTHYYVSAPLVVYRALVSPLFQFCC